MTCKRFDCTLLAIQLAAIEISRHEETFELEKIFRYAKQYGRSFRVTKKEIQYILENPIVDIIAQLEK